MAEVLVKFTEPVRSRDGQAYDAQACGSIADDGLWQGWIEFTRAGSDESVRTGRETEQPNLADLQYWAQGLSMVYLEGALGRALGEPAVPPDIRATGQPHLKAAPQPKFDGPTVAHPAPRVVTSRPILNPFLVYAEGPDLLQQQLNALSRDQLANIVRWYDLPVDVDLETASGAEIARDIASSIHDARRPKRTTQAERRVS